MLVVSYWFRFPSSYRYYIICAFILHLTAYQISEMHGEHRFAVCDVVKIMSKFVTGMFEKMTRCSHHIVR